jgi:hypothetical protein
VVDDSTPEVESDLRRRAAWLLVMLAIVAVLLIVVISAVAGKGNDDDGNNAGPGPLDSAATTTSSSPAGQQSSRPRTHHPGNGAEGSTTVSTVPTGQLSCPTPEPCILDGDIDGSIQAINNFRTQHGLPAVPGSVTPQAQDCALDNGSGCNGTWAETFLSTPDAQEAVQKIEQYAHFEDPDLTSVEVGWAYNPGTRLFYFAIIRND